MPLLPIYAPWNWGVVDGAEALARLRPRAEVTLLFGQLRSGACVEWADGRVAHGIPACGRGQPLPRTLRREGAVHELASAARPGFALVECGADGVRIERCAS